MNRMNIHEYQTRKDIIKYEAELAMVRLDLESKRKHLTSLANYDEDYPDLQRYRKSTQLSIEELKLKICRLQFELEGLRESLTEKYCE